MTLSPEPTQTYKAQRAPIVTAAKLLNRSIRGKLVVGTFIILFVIVGVLTFVLASNSAALLEKESSNQLSRLLDQSTTLLSSFLQARSANLDLWSSEPLVHSVAEDPALAAIFTLGLQDYFDTHIVKKPWIKDILLIKDHKVVYSHFNWSSFQSDTSDDENSVPSNLQSLPTGSVAALTLKVIDSDPDQGVLILKRQLADESGPKDTASILLIIGLEEIQQSLFGEVKTGTKWVHDTCRDAEFGAGQDAMDTGTRPWRHAGTRRFPCDDRSGLSSHRLSQKTRIHSYRPSQASQLAFGGRRSGSIARCA